MTLLLPREPGSRQCKCTSFFYTLTITVQDALGVAVVGETVTVTTTLDGLTPSGGVVLTDALLGVATIDF